MTKQRHFSLLNLFLILTLTVFSSLATAEVRAYLPQDTYYAGDYVTLTIESDQNTGAEPNLQPLTKDFNVVGSSSGSNITIINGRRSFKKSWGITLQPKKNRGKLFIPSLQVGNEKTNPITLNIAELPPEIKAETQKHVFIESSIDLKDNKTYVQQQIPYTVKLYFDSAMLKGEINTADIPKAVIEELGDEKRYRVMRGGKTFNVIEKHFVISPEKSGVLTIPPTTVSGRIALSGGDSPALRQRIGGTDMLNRFFNDFQNDPFFKDPFGGGFFSRQVQGPTQPFSLSGKAITIDVEPIPQQFSGAAWLPAEALSITDSWSTNPPELKQGEPVSRTITLRAKGLSGSQIPEMTLPKPKGMKVYVKPSQSETRTDGKTVYGIQHMKVDYIPEVSGKITIPDMTIDWWNVNTKQQETAKLPAWTLNIEKSVGYNQQAVAKTPKPTQTMVDKSSTNTNIKNKTPIDSSFNPWKIIGILLIIGLPLAALFYWKVLNGKTPRKENVVINQSSEKKNNKATIENLKKQIIEACDNNDKQAAASTLLHYARLSLNDNSIQSLGTLAHRLEKGRDIIQALDKSLYAPKASPWQGKALKSLLLAGLVPKRQQKTDNKTSLPPLYPA